MEDLPKDPKIAGLPNLFAAIEVIPMKIQKHSDSTRSVLSANLMAQSEDSRPLMLENNSADQPTRTVSALLRCLCAFFLVIGINTSSVAGEVVIFGSTNFGPEGDSILHRIDPLTGVATAVGSGIGFQRVSMDFDPTTGILYATGEREAGDLDVNVLLTINPSTGVGTEIGPTGTDGFQGAGTPPGLITDISFQPFDQTLFAWAYPGEWVATIDLVSGAATQLAFSPGFLERGITANSGNALAFLGSGTLVHAATDFFSPGFPGALHEIDFATTPANQMATVLASLSFPISPVFPAERFARANGMDFDFANGTLFASIVYSFGPTRHNFLGTIDTTTGDVTLIGQTKTRMDALTVISSVDIDILPGSDRNPVAPNSNGVVMLAILGTSNFDALQVSTSTIRFGPLEATPERCNVRDTNRDGIMDLSCQFKIPETGIACGDTEATLVGATFGGEPIIGTDSVKTAGCARAQTAYFNDFDGGLAVAPGVTDVLDGITTTEPVQGYGGVGSFGGDFLRNTTGGGPIGTPGEPTRLTLTKLPPHSSVDINFLLAIIDSWDGSEPGFGPDVLTVTVDGAAIFNDSFGFNNPTFVPGPGVLLVEGAALGFNSGGPFNDAAYDMGFDPIFNEIPHTGRSLQIEWFADGAGWQGGDDESWAIDNLEIILNKE